MQEAPETKVDISQQLKLFSKIRLESEEICRPLEIEDYVVQPVKDVSPPKWHLGHTTWFFENFILAEFIDDYKFYNECFNKIFNSYYKSQGAHWYQGSRGTLSRPSVAEVYKYREAITKQVEDLISKLKGSDLEKAIKILVVGLHHEQQHQELLVTDIKNILAASPLKASYALANKYDLKKISAANKFIDFEQGLYGFGLQCQEAKHFDDFVYDNETPVHQVYLEPFALASNLVTNGEFIDFIESGAYQNFELWLSDAWDLIQEQGISCPLYWQKIDGQWWHYTLAGFTQVDPKKPIAHVNFYEAAAFAKWSKKRLPTEFELEYVLKHVPAGDFTGLNGSLWQWSMSYYLAYPGYNCPEGAFGEYNSKFMNNQRVLKGSSVASPQGHSRASYRNFFYPEKNWQFTGIRLAESL